LKSERTTMPAYLAMSMAASKDSTSRFSAISQGKVMVGKPRDRFPAFKGALRIATWSWKSCLGSRAPESRTRSFSPMPVSLSLKAIRLSMPSAFTARGRPFSLASAPIGSTFWALLRHKEGVS
jgi:hypothetical protein